MKAMTLRLPDDLAEQLRVVAFEQRKTQTELLVAAIRKALPKPNLACDYGTCAKPSTYVWRGFRWCDEHGPKPSNSGRS